ncbi:hypothetical protein RhiJN_03554 [Ceratobasidium sp. AG-Ba]|nr:hypothetical protein RhiJN_03554 [Ceratobasidium sp. AG-Ba]QRW04450.1 hypothetical protein RhiLY_03449 [Ceratobasidium sp. AG-Ba]
MDVWPDLLVWHTGVSFLRFPVGVLVLACRSSARGISNRATLDCARAQTIFGTVLFQHAILVVSGSFGSTALLLLNSSAARYEYYLDTFFMFYLALGIFTTASLCLPLSTLRNSPFLQTRSPWLLNTKDLLAGETEYATRLTWRGDYRRSDSYVFSVPVTVFGARIARRVELAFLRRVGPVESKRYALLRNVAALSAIFVLIVRAITLLAHAQGQVFQTITRMEPCSWSDVNRTDVQIVVSHFDSTQTLSLPGLEYGMVISMTDRTLSQKTPAVQCVSQPMTVPGKNIYTGGGGGDVFDVFTCENQQNSTLDNVRYDITIRGNNDSSLDGVVLPNLWLNYGWQPSAGTQSTAEMSRGKRRFINSSFLRDTLGGMEPHYLEVALFPITTIRETPLSNLSVASGSIVPSTRIQFTSDNSWQNLKKLRSTRGSLPQICEVIEDYRASTAFDALGSIGGLLAIFQGLHILLFGRPMFWGIFGAKLLAPFGLLGHCSSGRFRRRLRDHYYSSEETGGDYKQPKMDTVRLHAFLRDYVIDFGPADLRNGQICPQNV